MLLDEITSALDPELVAEVLTLVGELATEGMTMLIATHEMGFARDVASKVVFLYEGRIEEEGPPQQIFSNPQRYRTRTFLRLDRRGRTARGPTVTHGARSVRRGRTRRVRTTSASLTIAAYRRASRRSPLGRLRRRDPSMSAAAPPAGRSSSPTTAARSSARSRSSATRRHRGGEWTQDDEVQFRLLAVDPVQRTGAASAKRSCGSASRRGVRARC